MKSRFVVYLLVVAAAVLTVAGLIHLGSTMLTPQAALAVAAPPATGPLDQMLDTVRHPLPRLILQLIAIIVAARVMGALANRVGQPPVVGEIAAGVLLGPSLLGWLAPAASGFLFPADSMSILQLLSQIGVVLFMFVVGVELDPAHLRGRAHAAVAVSHFSIIVPFTLGVALSIALYTHYAPAGVPFHAFALFCGIATSITAFPVLARMLEERRLTQTPLGTTALTCAAVDDVTAWSLLAFVLAITTSGGALTKLLVMAVLAGLFVVLMLTVVRPLLARVLDPGRRSEPLTKDSIAVVLTVLLSSALITEIIGIHALFGAFVAGAVMPTGGTFRAVLRERLESFSSVFLLPLFFAYTGLRTQIGLMNDVESWLVCLAIILVATAGKLGGTALAARWTGQSWRDAIALGALMNTRGLMELIALNVGFDLGILTPEVFAMMVLMALITTAMTGPLLSLSLHWGRSRTLAAAGPMARES